MYVFLYFPIFLYIFHLISYIFLLISYMFPISFYILNNFSIYIYTLVCSCAYTCTEYSGSDEIAAQVAWWTRSACCYHNFDHNFDRPFDHGPLVWPDVQGSCKPGGSGGAEPPRPGWQGVG